MDLMVCTLRLSSSGVASLDTVPSADLRSLTHLTREDRYIRAVAAFTPNKVMPLNMAAEPVTFALALFPDLLEAEASHLINTIRRVPKMLDVRQALFS